MEIKWLAIMLIGLALAGALTSFSGQFNRSPEVEIAAISAGLEQCRKTNNRNADTIWVKSCTEYIKTLEIEDD